MEDATANDPTRSAGLHRASSQHQESVALRGPWHWGTDGRGADRDPQARNCLAAEPPNTHKPAIPRAVPPTACAGCAPRGGFETTHGTPPAAANAERQLMSTKSRSTHTADTRQRRKRTNCRCDPDVEGSRKSDVK